MEYLGQPFVIQNLVGSDWLVTWTDAVLIETESRERVESISFTVMIPKKTALTIDELQTYALKRAAELLNDSIRHRGERLAE